MDTLLSNACFDFTTHLKRYMSKFTKTQHICETCQTPISNPWWALWCCMVLLHTSAPHVTKTQHLLLSVTKTPRSVSRKTQHIRDTYSTPKTQHQERLNTSVTLTQHIGSPVVSAFIIRGHHHSTLITLWSSRCLPSGPPLTPSLPSLMLMNAQHVRLTSSTAFGVCFVTTVTPGITSAVQVRLPLLNLLLNYTSPNL